MPTVQAQRTKRWSYNASCREPGFTVDRAEVEYVETDQATLLAQEAIFNNATVQDQVSIYVTIDQTEHLLFKGIAKEWMVGPETKDGRASSRLIVEDERGKMLDTPIPPGFVCRGATIDPGTGAVTAKGTALGLIQHLADLVGITIDVTGAPNYTLGPDITPPPGMTVGAAIARLLQGFQQVRRERVDLIRTGVNTYALKQRPTTLSGGVSIPRDAVLMRSYRRTFVPKVEEVEVTGYPVAVSEGASDLSGARAARECGTLEAVEIILPEQIKRVDPVTTSTNWSNFDDGGRITSEGTTEITRQGDRILSYRSYGNLFIYDVPIAGAVTQTFIECLQTFVYDGDGRLTRITTERYKANVRERVVEKTITYGDDTKGEGKRVISEGTTIKELDTSTNELLVKVSEKVIKTPTAGGTFKAMERWLLEAGNWETDVEAFEFSPGDAKLADDPVPKWPAVQNAPAATWSGNRFVFSDELIADKAALQTIGAAAKNQGGKWLVEVEIEMPIDLSIRPHTVVTFTGGALISVTSFFVTEVGVESHMTKDGEEGTMHVIGEAWLDGAADVKGGRLEPRGGITSLAALRSAPLVEQLRMLHGIVTAVNADGSAQVFIPEEGIVYPGVRSKIGLPLPAPRDRIVVERRGMVLWRAA
jgi:hypothetical protein